MDHDTPKGANHSGGRFDVGTEGMLPTNIRNEDFCKVLLVAQSDMGEGLLVVKEGRIRYANEAFCRISGRSVPELVTLPTFLKLAAPDQRRLIEHWIRRRLLDEAVEDRFETAIIHGSGRRVDVEVAVRPLRKKNRLPQLVAIVRDITERKRINERLRNTLGVLVSVYEAGRVLSSTLEQKEIGVRLLRILPRVCDLSAAVIDLRDEDGRLYVLNALGPQSLCRAASATVEARAARRRALESKEHQLFWLEPPKGGETPLVGLSLPLMIRDRGIGVLEVYGTESLANKMAVETLHCLAGQAASALENARLYLELAERERRLRDVVGKLIGAKEEERRRVAHEVHDGLTQMAVAAHQHLQAFAKHHLPDSAPDQAKLASSLQLAQQMVREARSVIADLRPTSLEDFGLGVALRSKVEALRADGWEISYGEALGRERLPDEIETALYRVAQEALANVRKHAQTSHVHIMLTRRNEGVYLEVRDWGRGFEPSVVPKVSCRGERMGFYGMRERITLLGGNLTICSRPGTGTRVAAEVPLPTSEGVNGEHAK